MAHLCVPMTTKRSTQSTENMTAKAYWTYSRDGCVRVVRVVSAPPQIIIYVEHADKGEPKEPMQGGGGGGGVRRSSEVQFGRVWRRRSSDEEFGGVRRRTLSLLVSVSISTQATAVTASSTTHSQSWKYLVALDYYVVLVILCHVVLVI